MRAVRDITFTAGEGATSISWTHSSRRRFARPDFPVWSSPQIEVTATYRVASSASHRRAPSSDMKYQIQTVKSSRAKMDSYIEKYEKRMSAPRCCCENEQGSGENRRRWTDQR